MADMNIQMHFFVFNSPESAKRFYDQHPCCMWRQADPQVVYSANRNTCNLLRQVATEVSKELLYPDDNDV